MNILPLILALALMLSLLTVEKMEKFKNQQIIEKQYQYYLTDSERAVFNIKQKRLYELHDKSINQLSFRYLVDKKAREKDPTRAGEFRVLIMELMKVLYGEAAFFKELKEKRPDFLEELLNAIEKTTEETPKGMFKRPQDITRLKLEDPELQKVFYRMLKGTVSRCEFKNLDKMSPSMREKSYVTLLAYINLNGSVKNKNSPPVIEVQHTPRETLKVLFPGIDPEIIMAKRQELAKKNVNDSTSKAFKDQFINERREGISDQLLSFKITKGDKSGYD